MRLICFLIFLCAQATTNAQSVEVQINYSIPNNNNNGHLIYYRHSQLLAITDFEKIPEEGTNVIAITNSGFAFKASCKKQTDKPTLLNITVTCTFDKTQSWMKPAGQNKYTLNHEQRHFDISFISCALFINKLKATTFSATNYAEDIQATYTSSIIEMSKLQQQYDAETNNGIDQTQQLVWNKKIDQLLLTTSF